MADSKTQGNEVKLLLKHIVMPLADFTLEVDIEIPTPIAAGMRPAA